MLLLPLLAYSIFKNDKKLINISLVGLVLIALITIPVYITGDIAEEVILGLPGVEQEIIEEHETLAFYSFLLVDLIGAFSIAGLVIIRKNEERRRTIGIIALGLTIVAFLMMVFVAHSGGSIRHTEIRKGYVQPPHEEEVED